MHRAAASSTRPPPLSTSPHAAPSRPRSVCWRPTTATPSVCSWASPPRFVILSLSRTSGKLEPSCASRRCSLCMVSVYSAVVRQATRQVVRWDVTQRLKSRWVSPPKALAYQRRTQQRQRGPYQRHRSTPQLVHRHFPPRWLPPWPFLLPSLFAEFHFLSIVLRPRWRTAPPPPRPSYGQHSCSVW